MKVAITIKTNLTYDGRVLAQLYTLSKSYPNYVFKIFILEDGPFQGKLASNIKYQQVKLLTRKLPKTKPFQLIKLLEYGINIFFKLLFFNPDIIHVHDESSILGPLLYHYFSRGSYLIYDDHELKNIDENLNFNERLMKRLEHRIFKVADKIIMANELRKEYAIMKINTLKNHSNKIIVVENYHFHQIQTKNIQETKLKREVGFKYLIHQGKITEQRGEKLLISIINVLPDDWRMVLIGITEKEFDQFVIRNRISAEKLILGGYIPYDELDHYWSMVDASVIFYETSRINNRYCAPNRLYVAANFGISLIVNENPVLSGFVKKYENGVVISSENPTSLDYFFSNYELIKPKANALKGLFDYTHQSKKLVQLYDNILN